jgi:SAM-dependent methyltransferase
MSTVPWWESAFSTDYQEVYAHRSDRDAGDEIAGLLPRLRQAPGPVLDAGCGNGRHLAALRTAGVDAIGFDLSPELLALGAQRASCRGHLLRCDMRSPAVAPGWGAILLLFTAFGYFDEEGNRALLADLARLLAAGGWLVLDLPDRDHLARTLVPLSRRTTASGLEVAESRSLQGERVLKNVTLSRAGTLVRSYTESVRLYSRAELAGLAAAAGLAVVDCWPGLRGPLQDDHRLVCWLGSSGSGRAAGTA